MGKSETLGTTSRSSVSPEAGDPLLGAVVPTIACWFASAMLFAFQKRFQGKAVCLLSVSAPKSVWTAHGTPTNSGLACALLLYYYNPVMTNRALPLGKLDAQKPEQR